MGSAGRETDLFAGGGETGERMRGLDWAATPLGPPDSWPASLRTVVRIMLASRYAMWLGWGPDYTFFCNDAYAPTLGVKREWAVGASARAVWAEIWADIGPRADSVIATGRATWDEGLLLFLERRGFPEETYHTFSYSPVPDDAGGVGGMLCVVTEDTERTIGERRLRTLRELAEATAGSPTAVAAAERAAAALAANPHDLPFALVYLAGGDGPTLAAHAGPAAPGPWPFAAATAPLDVTAFPPVAAGPWPEPVRTAVVLTFGPEGTPSGYVVAGISPRRPLDDGYRGFLALVARQVASAVAEARALEDAQRRADALAELDRAKTAFFSNVSHEFRTPLTLMLGPVEDLLAKPDAADRDLLEVVRRNGLRLQKLVNTLLDFARVEAGRARAAFAPTDLTALTADLASTFRAAVERAGMELAIDCPPLPEPAFVDRDQWEKLVLNLVSNAFKYTLAGSIRVALRGEGGAAVLTVADTGTGIPAADLPRLFDRFHRVAGARGRTHEGTGIGLALVKELVTLHGGTVEVASEVGRGSTFTVRVPLGKDHLPADHVTAAPALPATEIGATPFVAEALRWLPGASDSDEPAGSKPRIVLADDNADMRDYVRRLLAPRYAVEAVADGEAALAAAQASPPDLVLTDAMMPRLDGFGLLAALRADPRTAGVPVVVLSARAGEEARVEGLRAGADDYLTKPFSARELLARIDGTLALAHARREAAEQVRVRDARLQLALAAARMVAWEVDPATGAVQPSANAADLYGLPSLEAITGPGTAITLIHPDDRERVKRAAGEALRTGGPYTSEHRVVRRDTGAIVWVRDYGRAEPTGPGGAMRLSGVSIDVTATKAAEAALRTSEAQRLAALESAELGTWSYDPATGAVQFDDALLRVFGFAPDTPLVYEQPMGRIVEADRERVDAAVQAALAGVADGRFDCEYRVRWPDGTTRWVRAVGRADAQDGRAGRLAGVAMDTTDRKRAEADRERLLAAVQAERARLAAVLDHMPAGVMFVEPGGKPALVSPRAEEMLGHDIVSGPRRPEGHTGVHPDGRPVAAGEWPLARALRGETVRGQELQYRRGDDRLMWLRSSAAPIRDAAGAVTGAVVVFDDVDAEKAAAEALRAADRRKDEFLATLAHELRNPLAPLRNGLQVMRLAGPDAPAGVKARLMMERQLAHMVRLIDDLMDVSRITRGTLALRREPVTLAEVVSNAVEIARPVLDAGKHVFEVALPPRVVHLDGDLTRLSQVLANLLSNAAKYTPPGGRVTLTVTAEKEQAELLVRDTGVGIPADALERVFEMFAQVDRGQEKTAGGLGIGLALVRGLVEMHGGTVTASSPGPGLGSTFTVRLPAVAAPEPGTDPTITALPPPPAAKAGRRILVVDDNRDGAASMASMLGLLGNEVHLAYDGEQAVRAAQQLRPDLVLMDIGMPRLNGLDATRRIRSQAWGRDMTIIALTGWGQDRDREQSRAAGCDGHLVKPVSLDDLYRLAAMSRVVGAR